MQAPKVLDHLVVTFNAVEKRGTMIDQEAGNVGTYRRNFFVNFAHEFALSLVIMLGERRKRIGPLARDPHVGNTPRRPAILARPRTTDRPVYHDNLPWLGLSRSDPSVHPESGSSKSEENNSRASRWC